MIQRQYRVAAGFALIAAGVVVAVIGWYGVSGQTDVVFQMPYFASAGVGALMLMGFGAATLLSVQLDRDTERLADLEEAVRQLAEEVGRMADEVTPLRGRNGNGAIKLPDGAASEAVEQDGGTAPPRRTRAAARR